MQRKYSLQIPNDQQSLTTCSLPAPQADAGPQVLIAQHFVHDGFK